MPAHNLRSLERRAGWLEARFGPRPPAGRAGVRARAPWDGYTSTRPCGLAAGECREQPAPGPPSGPPTTTGASGGFQAAAPPARLAPPPNWSATGPSRHRRRRIGRVAPTAADGRDIMIHEPNGLLAITPPCERQPLNPSDSSVRWRAPGVGRHAQPLWRPFSAMTSGSFATVSSSFVLLVFFVVSLFEGSRSGRSGAKSHRRDVDGPPAQPRGRQHNRYGRHDRPGQVAKTCSVAQCGADSPLRPRENRHERSGQVAKTGSVAQ